MSPLLSATKWRNNAEMIRDVFALLEIPEDAEVLDPTYGKGNWWKSIYPAKLTLHNKDVDGTDFRRLPHDNDTFDIVTLDPPYVTKGGRETSGIKEFDSSYGLKDAPTSPAELVELICDGLSEAMRVTKPKGWILVKSMPYVSSGKVNWIPYEIRDHALSLGLEFFDEFIFLSGTGPQPGGRRQVHGWRNYSVLQVYRVKRKKKQV